MERSCLARRLWREGQRGQSIILLALVLVALIGMLALTVDVGYSFVQRRRAQNAADAGALAGAIVLNTTGATDAAVATAVATYVAANIAGTPTVTAYYLNSLNTPIATVGAGSIPSGATGVKASAGVSFTAFVAGVFGQSNLAAAASGAAQRCAPAALSGLRPLAVSESLVASTGEGGTIRIYEPSNDPNNGGNRGWVNFSFIYNSAREGSESPDRTVTHGGGAADLRDWMASGYGNSIYPGAGVEGDFIEGQPGVDASVIQEAAGLIGQDIIVPIYDNVYDGSTTQSLVSPQPNPSFSSGMVYYHLVGYVAIRITSVVATGPNKYIEGTMVSKVVRGSSGGGSSLPSPALSCAEIITLATPEGTVTATPTLRPTNTPTPAVTSTPTLAATATATPTMVGTATPTATGTPPTSTPTPTITPTPTNTHTATPTPIPTPPAPPAPLVLASQSGGQCQSLTLTWGISAGADYYKIYLSLDGTSFAFSATVPGTSYSASIPGGQTYYYKVTAVNAGGESSYSNTVGPLTRC